jgi:hypothetical protein
MSEVFVGKKCQRGVTGNTDPVIEGVKNINATSGSMNKINGVSAKQLSPMYLGPVVEKDIFGVDGLTSKTFENYWQAGKIFKELGHVSEDGTITEEWFKFRDYGYNKEKGDRHPKGTKSKEVKYVGANGKKYYKYYTAISSCYMNNVLDYIPSRKLIYAPVYAWLVCKTPAFIELKKQVDNGLKVQILDFDILPGSHKITLEFLKERINDPSTPFGHSYVLSGLLAGITPDQYCQ